MTQCQHPLHTVSRQCRHTETETVTGTVTETFTSTPTKTFTSTFTGEGRVRGEPILPSRSPYVTRNCQAPSLAANHQGLVKEIALAFSSNADSLTLGLFQNKGTLK